MESATIMFIAPTKKDDATFYTHQWAVKAIRMAKNLGYKVVELHKDNVTYDNVNKMIDTYKPRLFVAFSHGCPLSINGQNECVVTRRMGVEELVKMPNLSDIIEPLKANCPGICNIKSNPCENMCFKDTNIHKLKGTIMYAVACHSASQLGKCGLMYGVETYIGYKDLLLFPTDRLGSQDMFGDIHLLFLEELLNGKSVKEANNKMASVQDNFIRFYKGTKYVSLPMLWNKLNFKILGNDSATIYRL
jgi:hypothetical protein